MELASERCWAALVARDPRFDGRFFVAVATTRIFCRPVCPAPTPRRRNVRFFTCAAAAEAAGFRPCRRCRPERAPGTPAWDGTAATVGRALRLIGSMDVDARGTDDLAGRLGVGSRHLRRLFQEHLGVSPHAVVCAERAHAARRLLDETDLRMSEIAGTTGYRSIRQFNHAMRSVFGAAPTALRARRGARHAGDRATIRLRLAYRPPFDWDAALAHLAPRAIPGIELVRHGEYARTIEHDGGSGIVRLRHRPDARSVELEVPADAGCAIPDLAARARRLLDLDADPLQIGAHLAADPRLAPLVARRGVPRLLGAWDPFELAVRAMIGQQVSVRGATTVAGRLAAAHGEPVVPGEPGLDRLFPAAPALARLEPAGAGMPAARARAIAGLAAAVASGTISLDGAAPEATVAALLGLPGIGPWTASYVALRALGDPDAFPAADLGLRRAWGNGTGRPSATDLEAVAERWRPWRGYAAMLLWRKGAEA